MHIFLSKAERRKYYLRLRIKIYLVVGLFVLIAILIFYGAQDLRVFQVNGSPEPSGPAPEKFAIWCGPSCYWISQDGIVIEPAPDTEGSAIIKILDVRESALVPNAPVLEERFLANAMKILLRAGQLPVRLYEYRFDGRLQELAAIGANGEKFIFSVRFEATEKLFASLAEVISKNNLKNFEYIDLTVENRIYLKQR